MSIINPKHLVTTDDMLYYLHEYHPYYSDSFTKERNPNYDKASKMIFKLKCGDQDALDHFIQKLDKLIPHEVCLSYVPSSDSTKTNSGISRVAQALSKLHNRIDATSCLKRVVSIPKAAYGGPRSIEVHLSSIRLQNANLINGKDVVLLDDITTSGSSFEACKIILQRAQPKSITCFALGKTTR
ncbi:phosphoribosyltransferase [Paenibacillus donghaensis]|nr:phosphoribosyltransferase [Paenibacillus donghaensis]